MARHRTEIIHTRLRAEALEVEIARFEWVNWWIHERLHESVDCSTPMEVMTSDNQAWAARLTPYMKRNRIEDASVIHKNRLPHVFCAP